MNPLFNSNSGNLRFIPVLFALTLLTLNRGCNRAEDDVLATVGRRQIKVADLCWEGAVTAYDGSGENARIFVAGESDTTLPLQFFNNKAGAKPGSILMALIRC